LAAPGNTCGEIAIQDKKARLIETSARLSGKSLPIASPCQLDPIPRKNTRVRPAKAPLFGGFRARHAPCDTTCLLINLPTNSAA